MQPTNPSNPRNKRWKQSVQSAELIVFPSARDSAIAREFRSFLISCTNERAHSATKLVTTCQSPNLANSIRIWSTKISTDFSVLFHDGRTAGCSIPGLINRSDLAGAHHRYTYIRGHVQVYGCGKLIVNTHWLRGRKRNEIAADWSSYPQI